ncbi:NEL-type E3 ubiquitin ligase domain-containing protein [Pseudomonas sp. Eth.TT006]
MKDLRALHLDFNPHLERVPDLGDLEHLEQLTVRGSRIAHWPQRLSALRRLQTLDLRDNRIERLPAQAFDSTHGQPQIRLHGNPLSSDTLKQIVTYQPTVGARFGVTAMRTRESSLEAVGQENQSLQWLAGESASVAASRREMWEALQAQPNSADFFHVLLQLVNTAEFTRVYPHLRQRVWDVVEAAAGNQRLRGSLFNAARSARVSVDGYSALFSEMQVLVLCARARAAASTGVQALETQLLTLLRGLFRLQEVESLALADISARFHTTPMDYDQALEISLAYRVGLAQRLNLPAQPQALSIPLSVEVPKTTLDRAWQQVVNIEQSDALRHWGMAQRFWIEYLESAHVARFSAISEQAAQAMARLEGQVELTREAASVQMNAILDNFNNQRRELLGELTAEALARHVDPEVSGTPVAQNI